MKSRYQYVLRYAGDWSDRAGVIEAESPTHGLIAVLETSNRIVSADVFGGPEGTASFILTPAPVI